MVGALMGMGIPEYEAKRYEGRIKEGGILSPCTVTIPTGPTCQGADEADRRRGYFLDRRSQRRFRKERQTAAEDSHFGRLLVLGADDLISSALPSSSCYSPNKRQHSPCIGPHHVISTVL